MLLEAGVIDCDTDPASRADVTVDPVDWCDSDACQAECPPPEPYGYEIESRLHNLTFLDCDGRPVELHDLCGANAGLIYKFCGWCTGCYRKLEQAAAIHADYRDQGLSFIVVIREDALVEPATQEYCTAIRDRYDLSMTVVIDPDGHLDAYGSSDLSIITDENTTIVFKRRGASVSAIRTALEAELARP